jgi:hypothetical protein
MKLPGSGAPSSPHSADGLALVRRALISRGTSQADVRASGAVLVDDIAEATELPRDEVMRHLNRIRAELAWTSGPKRRVNLWYVAGGISIAAAFASLSVRSRPSPDLLKYEAEIAHVRPANPFGNGVVMSYGGRASSERSISVAEQMSASETAPPGMTVHVFLDGKGAGVMGRQNGPTISAIPYSEERDRIVDATEAAIAAIPATRMTNTSSRPYRDHAGTVFTPQPGKAHVTFEGWPGSYDFFLPAPVRQGKLGAKGEEQLRLEARKYLAASRHAQEEGLRVDLDPDQGTVTPPPGIQIRFAGRRDDHQDGGRLSFSDFAPGRLARRIELAVHNAFYRDHRPPIGRWTGSAEVDRNTPIPSETVVTISRKGTDDTFSIPTSQRWSSKDEEIVAREARAMADKLEAEFRNTTSAQ